jgi:hypothetical protein
MKRSEWRETLKPIIQGVIAGRTTATVRELRRDLRDAWEFNNLGPKTTWAYRVWCEEIRKALCLPNRIEKITGQRVVDFQEVMK